MNYRTKIAALTGLALSFAAIPSAQADDMVTRAYHLKNMNATDVIHVLTFAVANPTGKRILAGQEKHLVVTGVPEEQDTIAELLPVIDLPSTETNPQRIRMEMVLRASRYLQQKKRASQGTHPASAAAEPAAAKASSSPQADVHFKPSVPYKSVYSAEDAEMSKQGHVIQDEPVLPALSALVLKGIFKSASGSSIALLSYEGTNFTAREGGLFERNHSRVRSVSSKVLKDSVVLTGPDRIPREIRFITTVQ
jgi:type II secretory pathway component GspD/PulD (secretin)